MTKSMHARGVQAQKWRLSGRVRAKRDGGSAAVAKIQACGYNMGYPVSRVPVIR